jgi:hypothetical protein
LVPSLGSRRSTVASDLLATSRVEEKDAGTRHAVRRTETVRAFIDSVYKG